jgi:hypothetical protein
MSMKNSSDTIGNQTHDLPVCSAVPQLTAPPHAQGSTNPPTCSSMMKEKSRPTSGKLFEFITSNLSWSAFLFAYKAADSVNL